MVYKILKKADGRKEEEERYYICSIGEDADEFERAVRGYWGVEVKVHWHLDFTFKDDKNMSMGKTSANYSVPTQFFLDSRPGYCYS